MGHVPKCARNRLEGLNSALELLDDEMHPMIIDQRDGKFYVAVSFDQVNLVLTHSHVQHRSFRVLCTLEDYNVTTTLSFAQPLPIPLPIDPTFPRNEMILRIEVLGAQRGQNADVYEVIFMLMAD